MSAEPARNVPAGSSDLLDFMRPEFLRDPYPTYRALREAGPLHRISSGPLRFWVLTRHADVQALLRDPRVTVDRIPGIQVDANAPPVDPATLNPLARTLRTLTRVMLFRDPPDHTRLRGLANKAFTPRMVEALRPRIAALVDELLAPLGDGAGFDVVRELAEPLPILVIAELLGLPGEDRKELEGLVRRPGRAPRRLDRDAAHRPRRPERHPGVRLPAQAPRGEAAPTRRTTCSPR